ncbi:unnamed protein product, partial [marine sediment metagenome]
AQLWRLLLHEDENVWETAAEVGLVAPNLEAPSGLWLTPGTNLVWTVDSDAELWVLEDTVCIPVTGVSVTDIGEEEATLSWYAMTGADEYEYRWENEDEEIDFTDDTEADLEDLIHNTEYTVRVRVAEGEPFTSRWSASEPFTTDEAIAKPVNVVPENGMQDAPLLPSFLWEAVDDAVSYEFELGIAPDFSDATKVTTTIARRNLLSPREPIR